MSSSLNVDLVTTKFRLQQSKYNMFFKLLIQSELRSCVKVEVDVLGFRP